MQKDVHTLSTICILSEKKVYSFPIIFELCVLLTEPNKYLFDLRDCIIN